MSLFTRSMGEAGGFHRCGTRQGWEELGPAFSSPKSGHIVLALPPPLPCLLLVPLPSSECSF